MLSIEGEIITTDRQSRARVDIGDDGLITAVGRATGDADIVLQDELIFPGFVDVHVHAREDISHNQDYKEDFASAGEAAINGGVVAFAEMPNNPVPPVDDKSYQEKLALTTKSDVEVILYAGIGPHTGPLRAKVPYKVFLGQSVGDLFFSSGTALDRTLSSYEGQCVSFHCEDPVWLEKSKRAETHELRRPPEAEEAAVDMVLELIRKHGLIGKICHVSTKAALIKIIQARHIGIQVTAEVAPHHLCFDQSDLDSATRKLLQVNPPIRQTSADSLALLKALKEGDLDYLATDHAPHIIEEKQRGISGMPHLDTYGPFVSWLMKEQNFTPQDIARVCSFNPGQFINQFTPSKYGKIEVGYTGSLTVLDMSKPVKIEKAMLKTKCGWSPFEGSTFPGSVVMTVVKGEVYKQV